MMNHVRGILAALCVCSLFLTGCEGPSTRVLPGNPVTRTPEEAEAAPEYTLENANPYYIRETCDLLALEPRESGSDAEQNTATYLERMLKNYGYAVSRQTYALAGDDALSGINLTAVRTVENEDADILIIATHHDSAPGSPGANSCAAGVAAWLETARLLAKMPSDTELRFVSFGSGEGDRAGEAAYMEQLHDSEKNRVVGLMFFDEIGYRYSRRTMIRTANGEATELGDLLRRYARESSGLELVYGAYTEELVDKSLPVLYLSQENHSYEYHTTQDKPGIVSAESVAQVTDAVARAASEIMGLLSPEVIIRTEDMEEALREDTPDEEGEITDAQRQALEEWVKSLLMPEDFQMISDIRYTSEDENAASVYMSRDNAVLTIDAKDLMGDGTQLTDAVEAVNVLMQSYGDILELRGDVSYQSAFEERFYGEDMEEGFVSQLAGEGFAKDYAESFRLFVLTDKPETSERTPDAKISFFYEYPELAELRGYVRGQLKMES